VDRTLLLDLDGTLVDSVPDLASALNRLMRARGLAPFSLSETASFIGDGVARLVERAFAARRYNPDPEAVRGFSEDYAAHATEHTRLYPGVMQTLQGLRQEGWRLAVCTNKLEAAAKELLAALEVAPLLDAVGGGDSFPVRKPDPAHLLATLRAAGGNTHAAVMTGDHSNDVAAASGAGVPCIFAAWGYGPPSMSAGATAVAESFPEMAAIARRLLPVRQPPG
jgi:phosphoglycolate phosphatase